MKFKNIIIKIITILVLLFIFASLRYVIGDDSVQIQFSDKNMYDAIVEILNVYILSANSSTYTITLNSEDINNIQKIELNNRNITKINGIEKFTSLTELNLSNNNITDVSLLGTLTNLQTLKIYCNTINDISSLSNLTNLNYLNISKNKLDDTDNTTETGLTTTLKNLTNLIDLDLSHNYLKYTTGLNNLIKLKSLNLYDNAICNLNGLNNLNHLENLNLGENNELGNFEIKNLQILNNLSALKDFNFSQNSTPSIINYINNLNNLEILNLESNNIENISNISNITNLKILNLYNNNIKSIESIKTLSKLQDLILQKNKITNITSLTNNNELIFRNIKNLDISSNNIDEIINNNVIKILRQKSNEQSIQLNYEKISDTSKLPHYDKNGKAYVTYEDFGARCDGIYDDFIAIRNCHLFANKYGYEVRATNQNTYHIFKYYEDPVLIKTNVNWNNSTFIIHDEKIENFSGRYKNIFEISNMLETDKINIINPSWTINKNTTQISSLLDKLSPLNNNGYSKYLCVAINSSKKQHIRYGSVLNLEDYQQDYFSIDDNIILNDIMLDSGAIANSGDNQQDYFLIDNNANVLNDIQWDFDKITSFTIYPMPNNEINIKNGNFISNALESKSETTYVKLGAKKYIYFYRNIKINKAANINVSGIKHTLSYQINKDNLSGSYDGFLNLNICANSSFSNCSLFARKYSITGRSTYDLILRSCVNVYLKNITSNNINDSNRWGITGTNLCKNINFINCTLNRIDAHLGIYNLNIKNCQIGYHGLTITGQGILNIINTTIQSNAFITLREDYGSTWNGTVNVIDCCYKYAGKFIPKLINSALHYDGYSVHDFGYDCKMPNINVNNLTIDLLNNPTYNYFSITNIANIYNDENYIANVSSFLANYLPKKININGFNIINASNPDSAICKISNIDYTKYINNYNYIIANYKFNKVDNNTTSVLNLNYNEKYSSYNNIIFNIKTNTSSNNTISIYKDNVLIEENKQIKADYSNTFTEYGNYKIVISSISTTYKSFNYTGSITYLFSIEKMPGDLDLNKNINGSDILLYLRHIAYISKQLSDWHSDWLLSEDLQSLGDINCNNMIDNGDILALSRYIAAKTNETIRLKHPDWVKIIDNKGDPL